MNYRLWAVLILNATLNIAKQKVSWAVIQTKRRSMSKSLGIGI